MEKKPLRLAVLQKGSLDIYEGRKHILGFVISEEDVVRAEDVEYFRVHGEKEPLAVTEPDTPTPA